MLNASATSAQRQTQTHFSTKGKFAKNDCDSGSCVKLLRVFRPHGGGSLSKRKDTLSSQSYHNPEARPPIDLTKEQLETHATKHVPCPRARHQYTCRCGCVAWQHLAISPGTREYCEVCSKNGRWGGLHVHGDHKVSSHSQSRFNNTVIDIASVWSSNQC